MFIELLPYVVASIFGDAAFFAAKYYVYQPNIGKFWARTFAEKYEQLKAHELVDKYRAEMPLHAPIGGEIHVYAATLVLAPVGDGEIDSQPIAFRCLESPFKLTEEFCSSRERLLKDARSDRRLWDHPIVRLAGFNRQGSDVQVDLQEARYFESLVTNFSMDYRPDGDGDSLRERLQTDGYTLPSFDNELLANGIGVVCLLETSDGMLVVQERSANVSIRPNSLSASASGVVQPVDIFRQGGTTLQNFALAAEREAVEELGARPEKMRFLGLVREFGRGGKPEFYFFGRLGQAAGELREKFKDANVTSSEVRRLKFHECAAWENLGSRDESVELRVRKILEDGQIVKNGNLGLHVGLVLLLRANDAGGDVGAGET